jgi:hypothetical protein
MERTFSNNLSRRALPMASWEGGKDAHRASLIIFLNPQSGTDGKISFPQLSDHHFNSPVKRFCNLVLGVYKGP